MSRFQLVLGVPSKLTLDAINKDLRVFEVFLEESLKVKPRDRSGAFVAALMLGLFEANSATKIYGSKRGTVYYSDT